MPTTKTNKKANAGRKPRNVTVQTPVGERRIPKGQDWWRGEGKGHRRDFITTEGTLHCEGACGEDKPETAFPTLSVPRQDGRMRGGECRKCRDDRIAKAKKAEARRKARQTASKRQPKRVTRSTTQHKRAA